MNLEQFRELFDPLPGNKYMQVTSVVDQSTDLLYELIQTKGLGFELVYYSEDKEPPIDLQIYHDAKIQYVHNFENPFRALPRDHDMVLFKDIFTKHQSQDRLLRTAYKTLANAAHIIIMEKKGLLDPYATQELLERFEFRAPNTLDIVQNYDIIIAKKMHMWGNGL